MKSPLVGYYGGKARLALQIIPLIEAAGYDFYAEPFCGGASVYFALPYNRRVKYILNDRNESLINFYLVAQTKQDELVRYAKERCVYSKTLWQAARDFVKKGGSDVERAWGFFYLVHTCFGGSHTAGFARSIQRGDILPHTLARKIGAIDKQCAKIQVAIVENEDALSFIDRYDKNGGLFYLDPPYPNTNQCHFSGYKMADFVLLLERLARCKAKFILSSYRYNELSAAAAAHGWEQTFILTDGIAGRTRRVKKEEVLTANFSLKNALI